jgi:hypothetical protein
MISEAVTVPVLIDATMRRMSDQWARIRFLGRLHFHGNLSLAHLTVIPKRRVFESD